MTWRDDAKQDLVTQRGELQHILIDDGQTPPPGEPPKGSMVKQLEQETQQDRTYLLRSRLYWTVVTSYLIFQLLAAGLVLWLSGGLSSAISLWEMFSMNIGLLLLILQAAHLIASLRMVRVDDLAGIDFYGRPLFAPKTGLYVVPLFLLTLTTASRNYKDVRFPGPADKIFRVSEAVQAQRPEGGDMPPEGSVRPIFVTTGEPRLGDSERKERRKEEDSNPLDEQLNIEIAYFVRYRPNEAHGGIFRLTRSVARGGVIDETIQNLMREQSERDVKALIARQTTATTIENLALFNEVFALKLQESILRLGVQVDLRGAGLDDINASRETNTAQANVARARFTRQKTVIDADAEMQKRIREGRGAAEAERLRLEALAKGYKKIVDSTEAAGEAVIASETAKAALSEKTDTLVLGTGGVEQLFGLVKAGQGMLQRQKADT